MSVGRDYKRRSGATKSEKEKLRRRGLVLAILIAIGLFAALLTYLRLEKPDAAATAAATTPPAAAGNHRSQSLQSKADEKPKYDFYKELPRRKVIITADDLHAPKPVASKQQPQTKLEPLQLVTSTAVNKPGDNNVSASINNSKSKPDNRANTGAKTGYLIQAGAFSKQSDADRVKAQLALLGIIARVESGTSNNRTIHRVRIGPINGNQKTQAVRKRLSDNNIKSISIKVR